MTKEEQAVYDAALALIEHGDGVLTDGFQARNALSDLRSAVEALRPKVPTTESERLKVIELALGFVDPTTGSEDLATRVNLAYDLSVGDLDYKDIRDRPRIKRVVARMKQLGIQEF